MYVLSKCKIGLFYSLFDSLNYCRRQAELYCCIHDKLCPETDPGYRCWPIHCRQPWVKAWLVSNSKTFIIKTKLSQYHCCFLWQFDNFFVNSMPWSMTLHCCTAGKARKNTIYYVVIFLFRSESSSTFSFSDTKQQQFSTIFWFIINWQVGTFFYY